MDLNDVEFRFQQALHGATPVAALRALAISMKSQGVRQEEMYDLFDSYRATRSEGTDPKLYDAIIDTMDLIVGWCAPSARLFDQPFTPPFRHLCETFVVPFYLRVLHGNFVGRLTASEDSAERHEFIRNVNSTLEIVEPAVVDRLFADPNWRARMMGGWFAGLKGWPQYADLLGSLLVPSMQCYAGQAYCFALACFADENSARHLCHYLDVYLPQPQLRYDQHWAISALMWIDEVKGTHYSGRYLQPDGLWDQFRPREKGGLLVLAERQRRFRELMQVTIGTFRKA